MSRTGRPRRLSPQQEELIYQYKISDNKKVEEIAVEYNVSASTIMRIIRKFKEIEVTQNTEI